MKSFLEGKENKQNIKSTDQLFNPTFDEEYALALKIGKKRFGSKCLHEKTCDNICLNCYRTVITRIGGQ